MKIKKMPVGIYLANCYILFDEISNECVVVDPGGDFSVIKKELDDMNIKSVEYVLLTHGHADHTGAVSEMKNSYNTPVYINKKDYEMMKKNAYMYGNNEDSIDRFIGDGDKLDFGKFEISAIHTPGHTPGGMCFLIDNIVFTGDTLFEGSIGRTDLAGGDYEEIIRSVKDKLMKLPDYIIVLPGHGERTSIEKERMTNPFL
jgi:glyoxylase-like metal-dependent hydrolase (beta-lactamase superfamily II)